MSRIGSFAVACLLAGAACLAPVAGVAGVLGDASVAYRAHCALTIDGSTYEGMIYATPGHQRHEQTMGGVREVAILDLGSGRGYFVVPAFKTYVDFPIHQAVSELSAPDMVGTPVGRERVNGITATKYRVAHPARDGTRIDGLIWLSSAGIPMRGDGAVTAPDGTRTPFRWELSELHVGAQDPALFKAPAGFYRLPVTMLPGFLGGSNN